MYIGIQAEDTYENMRTCGASRAQALPELGCESAGGASEDGCTSVLLSASAVSISFRSSINHSATSGTGVASTLSSERDEELVGRS